MTHTTAAPSMLDRTLAALAERESAEIAWEVHCAQFDADFPNWEVRAGYGDRYIGEADFPSDADYPGLDDMLDWEAHSLTL